MSNSARKIQRKAGQAVESSVARHAAHGAPRPVPEAPREPKRFVVSVPLSVTNTKVGINNISTIYESSRVVNGRFKKSFKANTAIGAIEFALEPYLKKLAEYWPNDTDVMLNLIIEREVEDNDFGSFLGENGEGEGIEPEVESGDVQDEEAAIVQNDLGDD